jgi:hypothetical protein
MVMDKEKREDPNSMVMGLRLLQGWVNYLMVISGGLMNLAKGRLDRRLKLLLFFYLLLL